MPGFLTNNVRAGSLRVPVDLFAPPVDAAGKPQRDAMNAIVTVLQPVATGVPARVEVASGQARYATEQYVDRMSHVITIRFLPGLPHGVEVRFRGRRFTVKHAIDPEERHRWLHLLAMEVGL